MTKIEELKFALLQATPGEWDTRRHATPDYAPQHGVYAGDSAKDLAVVFREADSDFICAARNLMPQILEAVELLKELRNSLSQYDDGEWYLHDGTEPRLDYIDEVLEKLK